jgi:hypothetical protein
MVHISLNVASGLSKASIPSKQTFNGNCDGCRPRAKRRLPRCDEKARKQSTVTADGLFSDAVNCSLYSLRDGTANCICMNWTAMQKYIKNHRAVFGKDRRVQPT